MRALIHFPIIHNSQDLGTLNTAVNQSRTEQQVQQHHAAVEHFWSMIMTTIEGLDINYKGLKLYQDGLPVCSKEKEIVTEVAAAGSQNYLLLQSLLCKGAILMGTESVELLLQEHALMTALLQSGEQSTASLEKAQILLNQRDDYIAQRINDTLHDNEMAMLFLGLMHNIEEKLAKDIVLIQPLGKPTGHRCQHIFENN
jgi:pheromone shutdown protein TraB